MNFIAAETIRSVLNYDSLIPVMEQALSKFSSKDVVQPVRSVVPVAKEGGFLGLMPSLCEDAGNFGVKLVTFFPHNMERHGVQTHNAVIVLFETITGIPKAVSLMNYLRHKQAPESDLNLGMSIGEANFFSDRSHLEIMDGEVITTMRTAAVSAIATKYLAAEGSTKLAILGSGVQARSHFKALSTVCKFTQVSVWSRTFSNAEKCAADIGGVACYTAEEAVKDADVIVTVTAATTPILEKSWLKSNAHVNAVGACRPDWAEISPDLMRSSVLYVDSKEGALKESGDVILSKAEIYAELGEMILGQKEAQRNKLTVFKSLGMAIEDTMAGQLVIDILASKS